MMIQKEPKEIISDIKASSSVVLDVREQWELDICALQQYIHIPLGQLADRFEELPKDQTIYTLCHHGMRSARAAHFLLSNGFEKVINISGGIALWAQQIDSTLEQY